MAAATENEKKMQSFFELTSKFSLREIVLKYLSYLPLFVLSLVICLGGAYLYIRYAVPTYKASVQMLVGGSGAERGGSEDLVNKAVFGVRPINLDNEMELIRSRKLLERVVRNNSFNISYFNEGKIKRSNVYKAAPFQFIPVAIDDSSRIYTFLVKNIHPSGGEIEYNHQTRPFVWNDTLTFQSMRAIILPRYAIKEKSPEPYTVTWQQPRIVAGQLQGKISVSPLNTKTTIVQLAMVHESPKFAEDVLNALVKECIVRDVEMKKENSINTVNFIDARLNLIAAELKGVESGLQEYRIKNGFLDIETEFGFYRGRLNEEDRLIEGLEINDKVADLIIEYLSSPKNAGKLIPSNLGIDDIALNNMISRYNEAVVSKDKEAPTNQKEGLVMQDLNNQVNELKKNILESLKNIKNNFRLKIAEINSRNETFSGKLSEIPEKERILEEIKRQKKIKEGLYLYLLQKREEAAIASISTRSNYQEMDLAVSSSTPYEPRVQQIKTFALLLGLIIPVGLIYLIDMLNDKVTTRDDIQKKTQLPIVGEISHVDSSQELVIANSRNVVAEQFRILRTNLQFILPRKNNNVAETILITSTISGEGKSFISLNLAAVLSLTGKRVALLEFDLRKLQSLKIINNEGHDRGLTNYLINQVDDIASLKFRLEKYPHLDVFSTGPIPPNPAELIIGERMESLFEWLKKNYDYVIIDSAPVGLVSDSFALGEYADSVLYIVRQRYTYKKQLDFINEIKETEKLKNIALVVNDVNLGGRYGYYGYGYGYGYGYMYKYGFGYRYGYGRYGLYGTARKKNEYFDENKGYFDNPKSKNKWKKFLGGK